MMGTFHSDKGELHGMTVVVDTTGPRIFVGRCWEMNDQEVVLLDVDEHEEGKDGRSKEEFVKQAAKVGVWKKHEQIVLPMSSVATIKKLGDMSG
jgi:hypothetical protein